MTETSRPDTPPPPDPGAVPVSSPSPGVPGEQTAGAEGPPGNAPEETDDAPEADSPDAAPAGPEASADGAPPPVKRRRVRKPPPIAPPPPPINPAAALATAPGAPRLPPGLTAEAAVLDYKVNLENFYGPLDLLLHLVKEQELDVTTISIAQVADQYCRTLEMMKALDINMAGEFLVMAATLLAIKARALIPREALEEAEAQEDPSLELIRKLIEYKRFKERAQRLGAMAEARSRRFARGVPRPAAPETPEVEPLKDLSIWALVSLFAKITRSIRLDAALSILYADIPLERFMEMVLERLRVAGAMRFSDLAGQTDRMKVIGTFLAILQLAKDQHVSIEQDEASGEIRVALVEEDDELPPEPARPADDAPQPEPAPPAEGPTASAGADDAPREPVAPQPAPPPADAPPPPGSPPDAESESGRTPPP